MKLDVNYTYISVKTIGHNGSDPYPLTTLFDYNFNIWANHTETRYPSVFKTIKLQVRFLNCSIELAEAGVYTVPTIVHSNTTQELLSKETIEGFFTVADPLCPIPFYDVQLENETVTDLLKSNFLLDTRSANSTDPVSVLVNLTSLNYLNPLPDNIEIAYFDGLKIMANHHDSEYPVMGKSIRLTVQFTNCSFELKDQAVHVAPTIDQVNSTVLLLTEAQIKDFFTTNNSDDCPLDDQWNTFTLLDADGNPTTSSFILTEASVGQEMKVEIDVSSFDGGLRSTDDLTNEFQL